jgi:hypothetical protein
MALLTPSLSSVMTYWPSDRTSVDGPKRDAMHEAAVCASVELDVGYADDLGVASRIGSEFACELRG